MRHGHRFELSEDFIERLEGGKRREAIPPEAVVRRMHLSREDTVADLGAGVGYFTFPIAGHVHDVVAVDIEPKMIEILNRRSDEKQVTNLRAIRAEVTSTPIESGSVDHVLAAFVYHEVPSRVALLHEACRILKEDGRLTIVDFQKTETGFGPPVEERIAPGAVKREAAKIFSLVDSFETDIYYQLMFKKHSN